MATLKDFRDERLRKLEELKKLGVDPYPATSTRTHTLSEIADKFKELEDKPASVVGRVIGIRRMGKIAFVVVKDASGQLQLFFRGDSIKGANHANSELEFTELNLLDIGDFVEAHGK